MPRTNDNVGGNSRIPPALPPRGYSSIPTAKVRDNPNSKSRGPSTRLIRPHVHLRSLSERSSSSVEDDGAAFRPLNLRSPTDSPARRPIRRHRSQARPDLREAMHEKNDLRELFSVALDSPQASVAHRRVFRHGASSTMTRRPATARPAAGRITSDDLDDGPALSTGRSNAPYDIWNGYGTGRVKSGAYAGRDSAGRILSGRSGRPMRPDTARGAGYTVVGSTRAATPSRPSTGKAGGRVSASPSPYAAELYDRFKAAQAEDEGRRSAQGGALRAASVVPQSGKAYRPMSAPAHHARPKPPVTTPPRQRPMLDILDVEEDGEDFQVDAATAAKTLKEHQAVKDGVVYYFNAPKREWDPSTTAVKAREMEIDRRAVAVAAYAQLRGCIEDLAPGKVTKELDAIDPLRLIELGMPSDNSLSVYRAMYKYSQHCHERMTAALAPVGQEAHEGLLHDVWTIFAAAWEAKAGELFPSQVSRAKGLAADLERMEEAINMLTAELEASRSEEARLTIESAERLEELIELRPLSGKTKEQMQRADFAERERDSWRRRAERLKEELQETKEDAANGWAAEARARDDAASREAELLAKLKEVEEAAAAKFAAAASAWDKERAEMFTELEAARAAKDEAERLAKLAKGNVGSLKADIAFLREKNAELEAARKDAEERSAAAEENAKTAFAARDAAEAAKAELEAKLLALEEQLKMEKKRADHAAARTTLTVAQLAKANKRIKSLEESNELKQALSDALEATERETERADAERDRADAERDRADAERARADAAEALVAELRHQLSNGEAALAEEREKTAAAQKHALELELTIAELKATQARLEAELQSALEREQALEARVATLEKELEAMKALIATLREELECERLRAEAALEKVAAMAAAAVTTAGTVEVGFERLIIGNGAQSAAAPTTPHLHHLVSGDTASVVVADTMRALVASVAGEAPFPGGEASAAAADAAFVVEDYRWAEIAAKVRLYVAATSDEIDGVHAELERWTQASIAVSESALAKAAAVTEALRETKAELKVTKAELADTKAELESTKSELAATKAEFETAKERIYALEAAVEHLKDELAKCRALLAESEEKAAAERADRMKQQFAGNAKAAMADKYRAEAEASAAEARAAKENAALAELIAEEKATEAAARIRELEERIRELEERIRELEGKVLDHAASRDAAHASHATTKVRLALSKSMKAEAGAPAPEGLQAHPVDWGEDGPQPYLKEGHIMTSTPVDVLPYQERLLEEYNDASIALKLNQPQAGDPIPPETEQGFNPAQVGHLGQRGGQ